MSTSENSSLGLGRKILGTTTVAKTQTLAAPAEDVSLYLETITGNLINPYNPDVKAICVDDIAWALSRIPRFAGHTITEIPYNVAQHSIYVSQLVEQLIDGTFDELEIVPTDVQLAIRKLSSDSEKYAIVRALFHDGHEAYLGDIPSPIKKIPELRKVFKSIEAKLDAAIFSHLAIPDPNEEETAVIKYCDKLAQAVEGYQYMPSRGKKWVLPKVTLSMLQRFPEPIDAMTSYKNFIRRYQQLKGQ